MIRVLAICAGRCAPLRAWTDADTIKPRAATQAEVSDSSADVTAITPGTTANTPLSAIAKHALSTLEAPAPVEVRAFGIAGDEQADRVRHGGPRQAVYVYPAEHYAFWQTVRMQARQAQVLAPGALGENLLIEGLLEKQAWIGDRLQIGELILRVESPRSPCFKLDIRLGFSWASKMMVQSGFTGFYCSVERQGRITAGDEVSVRPGDRITSIEQAHRLNHRSRQPGLF